LIKGSSQLQGEMAKNLKRPLEMNNNLFKEIKDEKNRFQN